MFGLVDQDVPSYPKVEDNNGLELVPPKAIELSCVPLPDWPKDTKFIGKVPPFDQEEPLYSSVAPVTEGPGATPPKIKPAVDVPEPLAADLAVFKVGADE